VDLNIVAQRLDLPSNERFDLVVATNIFLYYDKLQQALALQNVSGMMKAGGLLLTNDELPVLPASGVPLVRAAGVSDGAAGRDAIAWYQKQRNRTHETTALLKNTRW
jgi:hypothetical protein